MTLTLADLAEKMRDIDFSVLTTRTEGGKLAARPMSNNRDVEYDGTSHYFAYDSTRLVEDIQADPDVSLSFQGAKSLLGKPGIFVSVEGVASLHRDRATLQAHWQSDLDRWFPQGADTPGVVLIEVRASRIHWWLGEEEDEIVLDLPPSASFSRPGLSAGS